MALKSEMLVAQVCPTVCAPMDCCPPGSSVRGILQARIQEWVTISGDLPGPGMEPRSPALAAGFFTTEPPGKPSYNVETNLSNIVICRESLYDSLGYFLLKGV